MKLWKERIKPESDVKKVFDELVTLIEMVRKYQYGTNADPRYSNNVEGSPNVRIDHKIGESLLLERPQEGADILTLSSALSRIASEPDRVAQLQLEVLADKSAMDKLLDRYPKEYPAYEHLETIAKHLHEHGLHQVLSDVSKTEEGINEVRQVGGAVIAKHGWRRGDCGTSWLVVAGRRGGQDGMVRDTTVSPLVQSSR